MYRPKSGSKTGQRRDAQYRKTRRRKQIKQAERDRRKRQREKQQSTAAGRYAQRSRAFQDRFGRLGGTIHAAAWLAHNNIAHPLLGIAPCETTIRIHDVTAQWLNLMPHPVQSPMPAITRRRDWLLHNCVSHPLMGILPRRAGFDWHDETAERMNIEGWV
ncbi:MAG: hypothetical protein AAFV53_21910 [Myxococcota bacterium]